MMIWENTLQKNVIKQMIQAKQELTNAKIGVLGLTFKENVADVRNTKVTDIITELEDYGLDVLVHDPIAEADTVYREYGIELVDEAQLKKFRLSRPSSSS